MTEAEPIRIPMEISTPPAVFDLVLRGYDRRQVDEHVGRLEQELAELAWQRDVLDAERQQVRAARAEMEAERAAWEGERVVRPPTLSEVGNRVKEILSMSQQEAEQLRARTARECEQERRKVEQEIAKAREEFAAESAQTKAELRRDLDLTRREADADVAQTLHNAQVEAEGVVEAARHEADGIKIRANEILGAARQERTKVALYLTEVMERISAAQQFLSEAGEGKPGKNGEAPPPRATVQIDAMDD
jgi:DivIVA domain-containing protein